MTMAGVGEYQLKIIYYVVDLSILTLLSFQLFGVFPRIHSLFPFLIFWLLLHKEEQQQIYILYDFPTCCFYWLKFLEDGIVHKEKSSDQGLLIV